ncbi:hypothetical protein [Streptomyces sp. 8N616]|uniref:hypothetical protein n=1 Tax=Streptomyces sp. 8N616 TaxID=3457414 RepID=UPI003FD0B33B
MISRVVVTTEVPSSGSSRAGFAYALGSGGAGEGAADDGAADGGRGPGGAGAR